MQIIRQSFIEIISQSINQTPRSTAKPLKRGYAAKIGISGQENRTFTLVFNKIFLEAFCKDFLFDENPSKETLSDMTKELANLTIGHAKTIAQEQDIHFNITTPESLGLKTINTFQNQIHFHLNKGRCSIYV